MIENWKSSARWINLVLTGVGLLVFGALWSVIAFNPGALQDIAQDYAVQKSEEALEEAFVNIESYADRSPLAKRAMELAREKMPDAGGRLEALRETINSQEMVEARKRFTEAALVLAGRLKDNGTDVIIDESPISENGMNRFLDVIQSRVAAKVDNAQEIVVDRFDSAMDDVRADTLIFSGSTALAFALAFALSVFKGASAMRYLLPVSLSLTVATLFAAYFYIFGQNWVMTILTNNYWGMGYLTLLSVLFAVMLDIGLNKARIVRLVLNVLGSLVPS